MVELWLRGIEQWGYVEGERYQQRHDCDAAVVSLCSGAVCGRERKRERE